MNTMKRSRKKATYRVVVYRWIFLLVAVLLMVFGAYTYYDYQKECQANASREAMNLVNRIVMQNDERLENLRQYYVAMGENDSIRWMLENNVSYSDYSHYSAAYDDMGCKGMFDDYVKSFTLVNFKTGWVLSNKGLFQLYEAYNKDLLTAIYEEKIDGVSKNYWQYDTGVSIETAVDRKYRVTVETDGLNLIMRLPGSSYNTYALFIANINMDTWKGWLREWTEDYQKLVVLDMEGNVIYHTDESLVEDCIRMQKDNNRSAMIKNDGKTYMAASKSSTILGWTYYILYDVEKGQTVLRFPILIFLLMGLFVGISFMLVGNLIYRPVKVLINDVSSEEGHGKQQIGNELEYLAGSYHSLKADKRTLEGLLYQQQDKLQELFQLRLIHGEVDEEEWQEYMEGFQLRTWQVFATVVVILDFKDEEAQSMVNEDVICLKILSEMPTRIKSLAWMTPIYNASAIFAIFGEDDETALLDKIKDFYNGVQTCVESISDYRIQMGVSATHTNYHHIRAAYRESINALTFKTCMQTMTEEKFVNELEKAAGAEDMGMAGSDMQKGNSFDNCHFYLANVKKKGNEYNYHFEEEIQDAVKAVDKKLCYQVTDAFCHYLATEQGHEEELSVYLLRYVNTILLTAVDAGINLAEVYPDGVKKIYRELLEVAEPDRERRYIKWKFIDPIIKVRTEFLENHANAMLEEIENLIAQKCGNISLTECADALGVHPTYIWKALKTERGKSFSDYVEEYKLNEAKRLLLESNMTVAEIAEQLHYTNAQNFIRFFSKSTGITPGKFRKLY